MSKTVREIIEEGQFLRKTLEEIIREAASVTDSVARADAERKHLEGLLKDRINFHLLFGSIFILALLRIEVPAVIRVCVLGTIFLISLLMSLAIWRTHRLVEKALTEIRSDDGHPYKKYSTDMWFPPNANYLLIVATFLLTLAFGAGTYYFWEQLPPRNYKAGASGSPGSAGPSTRDGTAPGGGSGAETPSQSR